MEPVTHFMTGACLARAGFNRKAAYATLAMTLAAEAPDLDTLWSIAGPHAGPVASFQHHRGITHTFIGLPFEALVVLGVVYVIHRWRLHRAGAAQKKVIAESLPDVSDLAADQPISHPLTAAPIRWPLLYGCILIALLSHILLDWTNNYGVRPFFPFNPRWYAGSIVFIFEPVLFAVLLLALIAPALFGLISNEVGARRQSFRGRGWAIFALVSMLTLWGWRLVEHDAAVRLATLAPYGPADSPTPPQVLRVTASPYPVNPFRWHTVAETPAFYQLGTANTLDSTLDTHPAEDILYKPPTTPATLAASQSWLGQVYLDWSSWPLVTDVGLVASFSRDTLITPVATEPSTTAVSFQDLRFMYDTSILKGRRNSPLSATVYLDPQRRIFAMEMTGSTQK